MRWEMVVFLPATLFVPVATMAALWWFAKRHSPDFRIQLSIVDLWVMALCFSFTAWVAVLIHRSHRTGDALFLIALLVLHQLAGAFFMYVLERLTPEVVRGSPMPLILLAGNLVGLTLFPAITLCIVGFIAMLMLLVGG